MYVACNASSGAINGNQGYFRFMRVVVKAQYNKTPIVVTVHRRNDNRENKLRITYSSGTTNDPSLESFLSDNSINFYAVKAATSTWDFYAYKTESWDAQSVVEFQNSAYAQEHFTITFPGENVGSLPSGAIQALNACIPFYTRANYVNAAKEGMSAIELGTVSTDSISGVFRCRAKDYTIVGGVHANQNLFEVYAVTNANVDSSTNVIANNMAFNADGTLRSKYVKSTDGFYYNSYRIYVG